jgi:hypothetical protein
VRVKVIAKWNKISYANVPPERITSFPLVGMCATIQWESQLKTKNESKTKIFVSEFYVLVNTLKVSFPFIIMF